MYKQYIQLMLILGLILFFSFGCKKNSDTEIFYLNTIDQLKGDWVFHVNGQEYLYTFDNVIDDSIIIGVDNNKDHVEAVLYDDKLIIIDTDINGFTHSFDVNRYMVGCYYYFNDDPLPECIITSGYKK